MLLSSLLVANSAFATITVHVKNDSKYDVSLKSMESSIAIYNVLPPSMIPAYGTGTFSVDSIYPTTVNVADVEYEIDNGYAKPLCHFRFVMLSDYRTGKMTPQPMIAEDEGGSYGNRAKCDGVLNYVDLYGNSGNATVTFTIKDSRY